MTSTETPRRARADRGGSTDTELVIQDGWSLDPLSEARLARLLARVPSSVAGVAAVPGPLPPGSSARVHAERCALTPPLDGARCAPLPAGTAIRAVLLRGGVEHSASGAGVVVRGDAAIVADPGAHVHDEWHEPDELEDASPDGRPPFPWRPVVVVLGFDRDPDLADWARLLVNDLIRLDVEARLAVPRPTGGLHLTRPCRPSAETVHALAPDVVLALDPEARERGTRWSAPSRSTVVVETTPDLTAEVELVSWRIGAAAGRLRARIGRRAEAPRVAELVRRLAAGPQPLGPSDETVARLELRAGRSTTPTAPPPSPARALAVVVVTDDDARARERFDGLGEHLGALGGQLRIAAIRRGRVPAIDDEVVIVHRVGDRALATDLAATRAAAGRTTVFDAVAADLEYDPESARPSPRVRAAVRAAILACGLVTTPTDAGRSAARDAGVTAFTLPTLFARARFAELARSAPPRPSEPSVVGWHVGDRGPAPPLAAQATAAALLALLEERFDLHVEVVGDARRLPATFRHPRVSIANGTPTTTELGRWTAQVWTPSAAQVELDGALGPLVIAATLGVPTVVAAAARGVLDGVAVPGLVVEHAKVPAEWRQMIEQVLRSDWVRARYRRDAQRRAHALSGDMTSLTVANRFAGWLRAHSDGRRAP